MIDGKTTLIAHTGCGVARVDAASACLEFFDFGTATPDELRSRARIGY